MAGVRNAAKTKVTIGYADPGAPSGPDDYFHGKLKSAKATCVKNREVKLYRFGVGREWHVVYTDTSNRKSFWRIDNSDDLFGKFYAATPRIAGCRGGMSEKMDNRVRFTR